MGDGQEAEEAGEAEEAEEPGPRQSPAEVRAVYDEIGSHFAKTREHPWPQIEAFLDEREGRVGLDVGCGNGRHLELLARCVDVPVGLDLSGALLERAAERLREASHQARLVQGDAGALPVRTGIVDLAVYVATMHHLPDRSTRRDSLDELAHVLSPETGRALVSVWSTSHDRFDADANADADTGFDTTIDWTLPDGETVPRFYHIYETAEFEADLGASDLTVCDSFLASGNCFAVVRR